MNRQKGKKYIIPVLLDKVRRKAVLIAIFFLPFIAINPGFNFNIGDAFLLIALALSIPKFRLINKLQIILLLFMITSLLSIWLSLFRGISEVDIVNYGQYLYVFVLLVPFGYTIFKDISFNSIAKTMILSGIVNAFFGIKQFFSPDFLMFSGQKIIKVSQFGYRAAGLATNPGKFGFVLSIAFIMCLYLILTDKSKIMRAIYIGVAIFLVAGIFSSVAMASAVMLILIVLLFIIALVMHRIGQTIVITSSVAIILISFLYLFPATHLYINAFSYRLATSENFSKRLDQYKRGIEITEEWILVGNGPMSDVQSIDAHRMHSQVLGMAVQSGAIPAFLYLTVYIMVAFHSFRRCKIDFEALAIFVLISSSFVALQVCTLSFMRIDYIPILLGVSYVIYGSPRSMLSNKGVENGRA